MDPTGTVKVLEFLINKVGIPFIIGFPTFVLFGPLRWVSALGLLQARSEYKMYLGGQTHPWSVDVGAGSMDSVGSHSEEVESDTTQET